MVAEDYHLLSLCGAVAVPSLTLTGAREINQSKALSKAPLLASAVFSLVSGCDYREAFSGWKFLTSPRLYCPSLMLARIALCGVKRNKNISSALQKKRAPGQTEEWSSC